MADHLDPARREQPVDRQRHAARQGALIRPVPELGTLVVAGSEARSWLNGLCTCDLAGKRAGEGAFGLTCSKTGRIQGELWILVGDEDVVIGVRRDRLGIVHESFDKHLIMEDAELSLASDAWDWSTVIGPLASELLGPARDAGARAATMDTTGLGGITVAAPAASSAAVTDALLRAAGDRGALATEAAWSALRVELMIPVLGIDYDDRNTPQEAALEDVAVSFAKGCYLGQEAVFMLQHRGHAPKRLVQLRVDGAADVPPGSEIAGPDGATVGAVTSRAPAPEGGAVLAMGQVKYKVAETNAVLVVAGRNARVSRGR